MDVIKTTNSFLLVTIVGLVISCSRGEKILLDHAKNVAEKRLETYSKEQNIPQAKFKGPEVSDHSDFWLFDYVFTEGGVRHEFVVTVYRDGNSEIARLIEIEKNNTRVGRNEPRELRRM
jgi:hypothetical protein